MTEPPVGIAFDRVGSGPALVMLHPLGADHHVWAPIVERLAPERELVTMDLPGFGESPPLRDEKPTARAWPEQWRRCLRHWSSSART